MKDKATIALVEPYIHGHREFYLLELTKQFVSLNFHVIIFTADTERISDLIKELSLSFHVSVYNIEPIENEKKIFIKKLRKQYSIIYSWWRVRKRIKEIAKINNCKIKLVFFPWLDDYIFDLGKYLSFTFSFFPLFFPFKWSGIYFHPIEVEKKWRKTTDFLKIKNLISICILDEFQKEKLEKITSKSVIVLPDFSNLEVLEEDEIAKSILNKANGRKIITLTGALQKRKGLLTLLDVAQFSINENWFFVFAGELFKEQFTNFELSRLMFAEKNLSNCYFNLKRINNDQTINAIVKNSDIIYASYLNFFHSSNLLTKSAYFKKPIIVSKGYCMEKRVNNFKLGYTINEGSVEESIIAIKYLMNNYLPPELDTYSNIHSLKNLNKELKKLTDLI